MPWPSWSAEELDALADPHGRREVALSATRARRTRRRPRGRSRACPPCRRGSASSARGRRELRPITTPRPAGLGTRSRARARRAARRGRRRRRGPRGGGGSRGTAGPRRSRRRRRAPSRDQPTVVVRRAEPREPARLAALGVHHVRLGRAVVAAREGDAAPVGREDGERRRCPGSPSAGGRSRPSAATVQRSSSHTKTIVSPWIVGWR